MSEFLKVWIKQLAEFQKDETGATAIEYAMIASTVTFGIVFALADISSSLRWLYSSVADGFN